MRYLLITLGIVWVGCFVHAGGCLAETEAGADAGLAASVSTADEIVVGKVIGVIESKPQAADRKGHEAHWVEVTRSIKGVNETGQRIAVRPNGHVWDDGGEYLLFLNRRGVGHWFEAIPATAVAATQEVIHQARDWVRDDGGGVIAEPVLWIQHEDGSGGGLLWELYITSQGRFDWYKKSLEADDDWQEQRLCGTLPREVVATMLRLIDQTGPGPLADDTGMVSIRYVPVDTDARGVQFKGYAVPDEAPCEELLANLQDNVLEHRRDVGVRR